MHCRILVWLAVLYWLAGGQLPSGAAQDRSDAARPTMVVRKGEPFPLTLAFSGRSLSQNSGRVALSPTGRHMTSQPSS